MVHSSARRPSVVAKVMPARASALWKTDGVQNDAEAAVLLRAQDRWLTPTSDEHTACFIAASVLGALQHIHQCGLIYRDLKPENLILDSAGYVKLIDMGFAKKLSGHHKTFTLCGTPYYLVSTTPQPPLVCLVCKRTANASN